METQPDRSQLHGETIFMVLYLNLLQMFCTLGEPSLE